MASNEIEEIKAALVEKLANPAHPDREILIAMIDCVKNSTLVQIPPPIVVDNSMFTMDNPYNMNLGNN